MAAAILNLLETGLTTLFNSVRYHHHVTGTQQFPFITVTDYFIRIQNIYLLISNHMAATQIIQACLSINTHLVLMGYIVSTMCI